ncbi:MAG TPA: hypothetical protein VGE52_22390, partial [Pirellulales bacterium]
APSISVRSLRPDPLKEYELRLSARRQELAIANGREEVAGNGRVGAFLLACVAAYLVWGGSGWSPVWFWGALAALVVAVVIHRRVVREVKRTTRAVNYYTRGLARLEDKWQGVGATGEDLRPFGHAYAGDLDLFGRGSLYQLLGAPQTRMGEQTLSAWLLGPADAAMIRARQAAVAELRDELDLREALAALDSDVRDKVSPDELKNWATAAPKFTDTWRPLVALPLGIAATIALLAFFFGLVNIVPFLVLLALEGALLYTLRDGLKQLAEEVDRITDELEVLTSVLRLVEDRKFQCAKLKDLEAELHGGGIAPSHQIRRLQGLVFNFESALRNQFMMPLAFVTLYVVHLAYAIERWRTKLSEDVGRWLHAVGEFEALLVLAAYHFERPDYVFPEIVEGETLVEFERLGHPLLAAAKCVRNNVALAPPLRLLLLSGSNMSVKSTLLRAVGVNVVLALAGSVVRAEKARVSVLSIGSSMRISDSLQEGASHFFAEIKRLREIVDLTSGPRPVLFLLDEVLHGTNSHDRRLGAEGVIKTL